MPLHGFNHIISWSDFIGRSSRPTGVDEDAQIRPEMSFSNFKLARKGKAVSITDVDIDISLIRSECWVIVRRQSEYLLKHEQGHYDILVLSAREFYNSLKGLSAGSTHELQKTVTKMQEDAQKKQPRQMPVMMLRRNTVLIDQPRNPGIKRSAPKNKKQTAVLTIFLKKIADATHIRLYPAREWSYNRYTRLPAWPAYLFQSDRIWL